MLIRNATVLTMDPDLGDSDAADVRVEGTRIAAVGPGLAAAPGEEVLDAGGGIVVPGFVDSHRHMWEGVLRGTVPGGSLADYFRNVLLGVATRMTPDDLAVGEALSARASLDAGVTTVQDTSDVHDSPARTDAVVGALRDSGLRAVFAYGSSAPYRERHGSALPDDARRVRSELLPDDGALVTMALSTSVGDDDAERHNAALARELGVRTAHHVRPEIRPGRLRDLGALLPGTTFVHGNGLDAAELAVMAGSGGALSVAPVVEVALGLGAPMISDARAAGLPITLSIDVEATGPTDMFTQMRAAYLAGPPGLPLPDVLAWATRNGARALGLDGRTGSITPGKQADLVLLRTDRPDVAPVHDPYATVVLQMDRSHVDTVLVAGTVHKRHGRPTRDDTALLHSAHQVARRLSR